MKLYLAARFSRREELAGYAQRLETVSHTVTSRWLAQVTPPDGRMDNHTAIENVGYAMQDLEDVTAADALVFFSEDPLIGVPRGARHVEFGYALALGRPVAIVGPRENVFHWLLPATAIHDSFDDLLRRMTSWPGTEWCFGRAVTIGVR